MSSRRELDYLRYGRYYKAACAKCHASTEGRCVRCGQPSTALHHLCYWSLSLWLRDLRWWLQGKPLPPMWRDGEELERVWGTVVDREQIGWVAVPLCDIHHGGRHVHSDQDWIKDPRWPMLRNRNRLAVQWELRLRWWWMQRQQKQAAERERRRLAARIKEKIRRDGRDVFGEPKDPPQRRL